MNKAECCQCELISALSELKKSGYKCYVKAGRTYGFIITPKDNVLYWQEEYYGGWTFSLQYKPSKENGTGCRCLDDAVDSVSLENVKLAETEGLAFARRLGAALFENSDAWKRQYWDMDNLHEI